MEESGPLMNGKSGELNSRKMKIRMNGDQALRDPPNVSFGAPSLFSTRNSGGVFGGRSFAAAIMTAMEMIEPMIFGSSEPMKAAAMYCGMIKETDAIRRNGIRPFSAFAPLPMMITPRNGAANVSSICMMAVEEQISRMFRPVMLAMVVAGTPTLPNAVGVELMTRQETIERIGSKPSPTRMPAGIATAVPKPAMPSMKLPKPQAMISMRTRLSVETLPSMALMVSIAPVFSVRLYVKSAAMITIMIGQNALRTPSRVAVAVLRGA